MTVPGRMSLTPARRRAVSRTPDQAGFTLIEVSVAMVLISIVLASFLAVTLGAMAASRFAESRTRANQLANEQIETLQGLPWARVGLHPTDCGYAGTGSPHVDATVGGEAVVDLTDARQTIDPYPVLGSSCSSTAGQAGLTRSNVVYAVATHVTWRDDPSDGVGSADTDYDGAHDLKHLVVTITWSDKGRARSLTQDALRAPTSTEVVPVNSTAVCALCVTGTASGDQTLTAAGALASDIVLSATTSTAASSVSVSYPKTSGTASVTLVADVASTSWTGKIPAGTCCFNGGTATLTFTATSGSTTGSATASVSLTPASGAAYGLTASVSPTSVSLDASGNTTQAYTLTATTTTVVGTVYATITRNGVSADLNLTPSNGGKAWTYTVPIGDGTYVAGSMSVTFTAQGSSGIQQATKSIQLSPPSAARQIQSVTLYDKNNAQTSTVCVHNGNNKLDANRSVTVLVQNGLAGDTVTGTWSNWSSGTPITLTYVSTASGVAKYTYSWLTSTATPVVTGATSTLDITVSTSDGSAAVPDSPGTFTVSTCST